MSSSLKPQPEYQPALAAAPALALWASACGQQVPTDTRAADESAIRQLDAQWSSTASANDLEGTVSYYSDDAVLLPPNAPIANGKPAIRAVWAGLLLPGAKVSWEVTKVEVARSSDLAYLTGAYEVRLPDPRPGVADKGKLLEVWKKQADGKWKVGADIFNSDLPVAALEKK